MIIDLDDWEVLHADRASRDGWCVAEIGPGMQPEPMIEAADGNDEAVVDDLREAYSRREPHAIAVHTLIKRCSPQEFRFWRMETWK